MTTLFLPQASLGFFAISAVATATNSHSIIFGNSRACVLKWSIYLYWICTFNWLPLHRGHSLDLFVAPWYTSSGQQSLGNLPFAAHSMGRFSPVGLLWLRAQSFAKLWEPERDWALGAREAPAKSEELAHSNHTSSWLHPLTHELSKQSWRKRIGPIILTQAAADHAGPLWGCTIGDSELGTEHCGATWCIIWGWCCCVQHGLQIVSDTAEMLYTGITFHVGLLVALNVKSMHSLPVLHAVLRGWTMS